MNNLDITAKIQRDYDQLADIRNQKRRELVASMEAQLDQEMLELETALSHQMHDAHGQGITKMALRSAVRSYGNGDRFNRLWSLVPDSHPPIPARKKKVEDVAQAPLYSWITDDTLRVNIDGTAFDVLSVKRTVTPRELDGEQWDDTEDSFDLSSDYFDYYARVSEIVTAALDERTAS